MVNISCVFSLLSLGEDCTFCPAWSWWGPVVGLADSFWADLHRLFCAQVPPPFPLPWQRWKRPLVVEVQWWIIVWRSAAVVECCWDTVDVAAWDTNICGLLATTSLGVVGYHKVSWRIQSLLGPHFASSPVSISYCRRRLSCSSFYPQSLVTGLPDIW